MTMDEQLFLKRYAHNPHEGELKLLAEHLQRMGYEVEEWSKGESRRFCARTSLDLKAVKAGKRVVIELESMWEGSCNKRFKAQVLSCKSLVLRGTFDEGWICGQNLSPQAQRFLRENEFRRAEVLVIQEFRYAVWVFSAISDRT